MSFATSSPILLSVILLFILPSVFTHIEHVLPDA